MCEKILASVARMKADFLPHFFYLKLLFKDAIYMKKYWWIYNIFFIYLFNLQG